ncbi:hypothetical protein CACET_c30550 [Clostridium aceticum]|uniref:Uncharacterized protein n=1 Tax=Clostridium aceticum TaxID=84022 RepID=A0A0D8IBA0_9CLOT|nr:hypothetical protein [Clostridium aceticum]AKL96499.1 hypothetical protein CACET_c30550 [Clostridium aceticum]KJF27329.1 hypothetical protein TZ02_08310 [Clostridium aceticum]
MKDRDGFKAMLHQYHVPQGKEEDISRTILAGQKVMEGIIPSKTAFHVLLRDQVRYISPYLWMTQLIGLIMMMVLSINLIDPHFEIQRILFIITPILAFFAVPELIKSMVYGMSELENTCKNSIAKILVARLFIIGSINLVALTIMITFLSVQYRIPFTQVLIYGLVPFNIVNGIHLLVFHFVKIRSSVTSISISLCLFALMRILTDLSFFAAITETLWMMLFMVTTAFFLAELYYFMKHITKKEAFIQWN